MFNFVFRVYSSPPSDAFERRLQIQTRYSRLLPTTDCGSRVETGVPGEKEGSEAQAGSRHQNPRDPIITDAPHSGLALIRHSQE